MKMIILFSMKKKIEKRKEKLKRKNRLMSIQQRKDRKKTLTKGSLKEMKIHQLKVLTLILL